MRHNCRVLFICNVTGLDYLPVDICKICFTSLDMYYDLAYECFLSCFLNRFCSQTPNDFSSLCMGWPVWEIRNRGQKLIIRFNRARLEAAWVLNSSPPYITYGYYCRAKITQPYVRTRHICGAIESNDILGKQLKFLLKNVFPALSKVLALSNQA